MPKTLGVAPVIDASEALSSLDNHLQDSADHHCHAAPSVSVLMCTDEQRGRLINVSDSVVICLFLVAAGHFAF